MALIVEPGQDQEDTEAKIKAEIVKALEDVKQLGADTIVIFSAHGDRCQYRYIGKPCEVFELAQLGHKDVMRAFELNAAEPLPGQRLS